MAFCSNALLYKSIEFFALSVLIESNVIFFKYSGDVALIAFIAFNLSSLLTLSFLAIPTNLSRFDFCIM